MPVVFMFWFSKWLESVRLVAWFPGLEPASTDLVYAGSRDSLTASDALRFGRWGRGANLLLGVPLETEHTRMRWAWLTVQGGTAARTASMVRVSTASL